VTPRIVNAMIGSSYKSECSLNDYEMTWKREDGQRSNAVINNGLLVIDNVQQHNAGLYVCYATDNYGNTSPVQSIKIEIVSSPLNIGGFGPPRITFEPSNFATSVTAGDQLWVRCVADGSESMTVKWVIVGRPSTFS